jgi:hypothetical protein
MIVVKIDMHPGGDESRASSIALLEISNLSPGMSGRANYGLVLTQDGDEVKRIGFLTDQPRRDGYALQLVANALKALGIGPTREGHEPIDWTQLPMEGDEE